MMEFQGSPEASDRYWAESDVAKDRLEGKPQRKLYLCPRADVKSTTNWLRTRVICFIRVCRG